MILARLFSYLPFWLLYALSDFLSWLLYRVLRYRLKVVLENLRWAFPDKSADWHQNTARAFYRSFTDTWLEALKSLNMSEADIRKRVQFENPDILKEYEQQNISSMELTGHNANWEWLLLRGSLSIKNVIAVYLRVDNPFFEKLMFTIRNRHGITLVEKAELMRLILSTKGQYRNIAMVADQAPRLKGVRHWQLFLNRPAPFFNAAEKLVLREGMLLLYVGIRRTKRGHYTIWFEELAKPPYRDIPEGELTSLYIKALERNIYQQPELYLWSHKRWKHKLPEGTKVYQTR